MAYLYGDRTYGVGHYGWLNIASSVGAPGDGQAVATVISSFPKGTSVGEPGDGTAIATVTVNATCESVGGVGTGSGVVSGGIMIVASSIGDAGDGQAIGKIEKFATAFSEGVEGDGQAQQFIGRSVQASSVGDAGTGFANLVVARTGTAFSVGFPGQANAVGVSAFPLSFILPDHPVWTKRDVLTISGPTRQSKYF
jgi:hypothetical protein